MEIKTISIRPDQKRWIAQNADVFKEYSGFSGWVRKLIDIKKKKVDLRNKKKR